MRARFAAVGLDHPHIYGQTRLMLDAGAELAGFWARDEAQAGQYVEAFPGARRLADPRAIYDDASIHCVLTASIPDERAAIAIAAMAAGKDVMTDKPGCVSLAELDAIEAGARATGRIWSVCFSERLEQRATAAASRLVREGAIGEVLQTIGLGPHRIGLNPRPDWFYQRGRNGGILADICAHQADQFLHFTGSTRAEVVAAHVANHAHPDRPEFQDFGEVLFRGDRGTGYARVDWFTPDGLGVWGDGRLTILGTEGYIELRKYVDIGGAPGGDHLFLVDGRKITRVDCSGEPLPYGPAFCRDILERGETAMPQAHTFLAQRLALEADAKAARVVRGPEA